MGLQDAFGRSVTDLRVAVTRDCNLACFFCHREGASPTAQQMTAAELGRLVRVGARLGVVSVKLTGGEPLLRPDIAQVVHAIKSHVREVSLVTNGTLLEGRAGELACAGLDRVNVSLHALDAKAPRQAREALESASRAVATAKVHGLGVKVNFVATRENEALIPGLVSWAQETAVPLQLIELHSNPQQWPLLEASFVSLEPTESMLSQMAVDVTNHRLHARPIYHLPKATVEVTKPMNNWRFCAGCQRLRVTADGKFQTCLLTPKFLDVLQLMRDGCDDAAVEAVYRQAAGLRRPTWTAPPETTEGQPREVSVWSPS